VNVSSKDERLPTRPASGAAKRYGVLRTQIKKRNNVRLLGRIT